MGLSSERDPSRLASVWAQQPRWPQRCFLIIFNLVDNVYHCAWDTRRFVVAKTELGARDRSPDDRLAPAFKRDIEAFSPRGGGTRSRRNGNQSIIFIWPSFQVD